MLRLLRDTWPLMLGVLLLTLGNGMQGTLLGIRGAIEGFSAVEMSLVMTAYFLGFLVSTRIVPRLIARVGHVRVFAAFGSVISAALLLYAAFPNLVAWIALRVIVGAGFAAVYVVAESWLNDAVPNETRGQALSTYMMVQLLGVITAQGLLNLGDPAGWSLFVLISVAVSLSFAPILLSVSPAPMFAGQQTMPLGRLFHTSPLGFVGVLLLGAVYAAMFSMAAVYGAELGLGVAEITGFVAAIYLGGLMLQYPVGWLSDRIDRRRLALGMALGGAAAAVLGAALGAGSIWVMTAAGFLVGGVANPLYSLLIAHANDFLEPEDRASASGGLLFLFGVGSLFGPVAVGAGMALSGPWAFFAFMAAVFLGIAGYAGWRVTRRAAPRPADTGGFSPIPPQATVVAVSAAVEAVAEAHADAIETAQAEAEGEAVAAGAMDGTTEVSGEAAGQAPPRP